MREHDREVAGLADRLAEVSYLLSDVAADVSSYASGLDTDPARLAAVSERRSALVALTRSYGSTVDEVLTWSQQAAARLLDLDGTDERIEELAARSRRPARPRSPRRADGSPQGPDDGREAARRRGERRARLAGDAARPARRWRCTRATTATGCRSPTAARCGMGPTGLDDVELLLAANVGAEPRPLAKGASGGELSRVMLGVEVALAATNPVPTFVFDEVDAGVGGKAAVEVGRRLALLARHAQVLVVTHLPQVAAFADQHVVVVKSNDGTVTSSGLSTLDDAGRVRELSRMLAGLEDSDTALAHAEELLATAQETRSGG